MRSLHRPVPFYSSLLSLPLIWAVTAGCPADPGDPAAPYVEIGAVTLVGAPATSAAAAAVSGLTVRVVDTSGSPVAGEAVEVQLVRGGGSVDAASLVTGQDGTAAIGWTLGPAPIDNAIELRSGIITGTAVIRATIEAAAEPVPEAFGDVHAFLDGLGRAASTEDLAFESGDSLLIGIPGGLARVAPDGTATEVALTGEPIDHPLGVAVGPDGTWWVCDSGAGALKKVDASGVVSVVVTHDGTDDLNTPNHVTFDSDGKVIFTDSCLGRVYRLDPASGQIEATVQFDLPSQGGPNGVAIGPDGLLYVTTENTALLCVHNDVELTAQIGGLFSMTLSATGFGEPQTVAADVGMFGDGLTFDAEGNLYVIFDTAIADQFVLDESIVFVLPAGGTELVRFFGVRDQLVANLAFGRGDFGDSSLYLTLLAVPPFTPAEARGLVRIEAGVGAPWPAQRGR